MHVLGYLRVKGTCIYPLGSQRPRDKNNAKKKKKKKEKLNLNSY